MELVAWLPISMFVLRIAEVLKQQGLECLCFRVFGIMELIGTEKEEVNGEGINVLFGSKGQGALESSAPALSLDHEFGVILLVKDVTHEVIQPTSWLP